MASIANWARRAAASEHSRRDVQSGLSRGKGSRLASDREEYLRKRGHVERRREEMYQRAQERASNNKDVLRRVRGDQKKRAEAGARSHGRGVSIDCGPEASGGVGPATGGAGSTESAGPGRGGDGGTGGGARRRGPPKQRDVWADVYDYEKHRLEQEQQAERAAEQRRRKELVVTLNRQRHERVDALARERHDMDDYAQAQTRDLEVWRETELAKRAAAAERNQRTKAERDQQLARVAERRKADERRRVQQEQEAVQRNVDELQMEQERQRQAKLAQQEQMRQVKLENAENLKRKQAERLRELEEERRLAREYAEMLEKQERARQANLAKMEARQRMLGEVGRGAQEDMAARLKADEDRADMWRRKYEGEADRRIAAKQTKQEEAKRSMLDALSRQIAEKDAAGRRNADEARIFARKREAEVEALMRKDEAEATARRRRNVENQSHVLRQMRQRRAASGGVGRVPMSDTERKINDGLLRKVVEFKSSQRKAQQKKTGTATYRISQVPM